MNKFEIRAEIENLRFHRDTLDIMKDTVADPVLKMEIKTELHLCLKQIKHLKEMLLDIYVAEIRNAYPHMIGEAIYESEVLNVVSKDVLCHLVCKGKLEPCGIIDGRRLYAL